MINKILIANRGEIAVRIILACKELGIRSVAVYSKADENSLHVKLADEAICIGEAPAKRSYLHMNNIISAAISTGCNAIHPGYGFLSENEKFASMVENCNLKFIGPSSKSLALVGNKATAKEIAKNAGLNVILGSNGPVKSLLEAGKISEEIGFPVLLKAVNGGGGKGITIVNSIEELTKEFERTSLEAKASFDNSDLYLEKYIKNPHHIEVQILADSFGNIIHLGERDCSIQRRNQKIIEEAPSIVLDEQLRDALGNDAITLAKAIGYENAGTVEFLVDEDKNYYFIEMNARLQVEHPVTEMITGIDIVKEQIKIAYKQKLDITQEDVIISGHSIECRINAEDPNFNFLPSPGVIETLFLPVGPGVRIDTHIYTNYTVPPYYDSNLCKLIVHAKTRKEAIRRMRVALEQLIIGGIKTNIELQYLIMHNTDYVKGEFNTNFMDEFIKLVKEASNE